MLSVRIRVRVRVHIPPAMCSCSCSCSRSRSCSCSYSFPAAGLGTRCSCSCSCSCSFGHARAPCSCSCSLLVFANINRTSNTAETFSLRPGRPELGQMWFWAGRPDALKGHQKGSKWSKESRKYIYTTMPFRRRKAPDSFVACPVFSLLGGAESKYLNAAKREPK